MKESNFDVLPDEFRENSFSASELMRVAVSPAHYRSAYILNETETTPSMMDGSLIHEYLLEREKFDEKYTFQLNKEDVSKDPSEILDTVDDLKRASDILNLPKTGKKSDFQKRIKEHLGHTFKIWEDELSKHSRGRKILTPTQTKRLTRIERQVKENKDANDLIFGEGLNEQIGHYYFKAADCQIRFKLDKLRNLKNGNKICIDLKRSDKITGYQFEKFIADSKLHIQAALYVDAVKAITGVEPLFAWVCVQPNAPYICSTYVADFAMIEVGRLEARRMANKLRECRRTQHWPGPEEGLINVALPDYSLPTPEEDENVS